MEGYNRRSSDLDNSIDLLFPSDLSESQFTFQDLKNEYTKAFNYIDILKLEKNNLINTMKLMSSPRSESPLYRYPLGASRSTSNLRPGTPNYHTERLVAQLEKENKELKRMLAESNMLHSEETDKKVAMLELENAELKKSLGNRMIDNGYSRSDRHSDLELEKENRELKKEVGLLTEEVVTLARQLQELEDENTSQKLNQDIAALSSQEIQNGLVKYSTHLLNAVDVYPVNHAIRIYFEERFTSPYQVEMAIENKEYASLLLKSFKYISDILINREEKPILNAMNTTRSPRISPSQLGDESPISPIMAQTTSSVNKGNMVKNAKPHVKIEPNSGSAAPNSANTTGIYTPSTASMPGKKMLGGKHGRTLSQQITNNTESHIIYSKKSSIGREPSSTRNNPSVGASIDVKKGSQTARVDNSLRSNPLQNILTSPHGTSKMSARDIPMKRNDLDVSGRMQNDWGIDTRGTVDTLASPTSILEGRKRGHKRGNTDGYLSSKFSQRREEEAQSPSRAATYRQGGDEGSNIQLKSVLKVPTYHKGGDQRNDSYRGYSARDNIGASRYNGGEVEPLNVDSPANRSLLSKGVDDSEVYNVQHTRRKPKFAYSRGPSLQNSDYEQLLGVEEEEDSVQRYIDEGGYGTSVVPKPQTREEPGDFSSFVMSNVGNRSVNRNRSQDAYDVYEDSERYGRPGQKQMTFEPRDDYHGYGEPVVTSHRNKKSPPKKYDDMTKSSFDPKYRPAVTTTSFKVSFGRTESVVKPAPHVQEGRTASPSVLDITKKKRVDHIYQTYDIIKGEEMRNKKVKAKIPGQQYEVAPPTPVNAVKK